MEDLKVRCQTLYKALSTLQESLLLLDDPKHIDLHPQIRDSVIKRFEYSMDTFWKYTRAFLEQKYTAQNVVASPKSVFRAMLLMKFIAQDEFDVLIDMVDDRNMTSHTYNETLAEVISEKTHKYCQVMLIVAKRSEAESNY